MLKAVFSIHVALGLILLGVGGCEDHRVDNDNVRIPSRTEDVVLGYNPFFVPSPDEVIDKMFEMANVNKNDVVFDLGCGDGRVLFKAAKKFGCRCVGLDLNPQRIREAMDLARDYKVGALVELRHADARKPTDLADATVVVLYMFPDFLDEWYPIAERTLKPGTRIVAHDYTWSEEVNGWQPSATEIVRSAYRDHHKVFLFIVPEKQK